MTRTNRNAKEMLIKKVVDHLKFLERELKRADDISKQNETEMQINVINKIYEQLKGDFVSNFVVEELNTKFEYERQCYQQKIKRLESRIKDLKNELRLKDEKIDELEYSIYNLKIEVALLDIVKDRQINTVNQLMNETEEKSKETKELKSRIMKLERENKEIKDLLDSYIDINDPKFINLKNRCEELTEQVSAFSNNID